MDNDSEIREPVKQSDSLHDEAERWDFGQLGQRCRPLPDQSLHGATGVCKIL